MLLFELFSRTVSGRSAEDVTDEGILREPDDEDDGTAAVFSVSYSSSSSCKTPQITHQETDGQPRFPALSCANGMCNNFLLQQDPLTGSLTLLPVQIAVPQPITGADPLSTDPLKASGVSVTHRDSGTDIRAVHHCMKRSRLQHIMELLREEFTFDEGLENGVQDLAMGETLSCFFKDLFSLFYV